MKPKYIHLAGTYIVNAPRQDIYDIMSDFENLPKNFPSVAKSVRFTHRDGDCFSAQAQTKAFFGSKTFSVRMEGRFRPPEGFVSTNVSALGTEREVFAMEEIPGGTRINYRNDVEVESPFFALFDFLIRHFVLWYWERAVIGRLKEMLEKK